MNSFRMGLICLVCVCVSVLTSCYQSSEPLSKPGVVLDHSLVGTWECVPDPKEDPEDRAVVSIFQFDPAQYYIEWNEGDKITRYRSYPTDVGNSILLNVQEVSQTSDNDKWVFLRYKLTQTNELKFSIVSDKSVTSKNEKDALAEIRKRAAQDDLYAGVASCIRQKS